MKPQTRRDQIADAFFIFHEGNPHVWKLFERFTLQLIARGHKHFSSDAVLHRIRWESAMVVSDGETLKINNNFSAWYARLFDARHERYAGFFRNRRMKSADNKPASPNIQEFVDHSPVEEMDERLRVA